MKKIFASMLMVGATAFTACDSKTGGNVGVDSNAEQTTGNSNGIVNPQQNDTSGADVIEKTQTSVGNSQTRGETNDSRSQTTENVVISSDSTQR